MNPSNSRAKQIARKVVTFLVAGLLLFQAMQAWRTHSISMRHSAPITEAQDPATFWLITSIYTVSSLIAFYVAITLKVSRSKKRHD